MADDLSNYKLQLQQVEVALLTDAENAELLKLKDDIEQLITLQKELIKTQEVEQRKYIEPSSSANAERTAYYKDQKIKAPLKIWKVGEKCMARDATNGQFYEATIEAITDDGDVSVIFDTYQNKGQTNVKDLKEYKVRVEVFPQNSNKRVRPNHKEYLKKKKLKKQQRLAELEEEREVEKNKWLQFNSKASKKQLVKTQSIFQSPDTVSGRVGVGTCGISGKQMTSFQTTRGDIHKKKN
ncbi:CLUMA_CG008919, isoform A [Clunio marinus]|uniref:CLUMA_CG008919, isoform A n=1 Tax=Clunio marinus TaxID=568069 RepID=A0A1J1I6T5_9DIPT|nr:CLUMA_CG008919, isoform A [Clunio marinus]